MRHHLLDVNLLIALLDEAHPAHATAHRWAGECKGTFVTCPLVENGAFRIMTQPAYTRGASALTLAVVLGAFRQTLQGIAHQRWDDTLSLADTDHFDHAMIYGPRQLTDIYLLGLAVAHEGQLVTLDQNIPLAAVRGARAENLRVL
ncbi:MAG: TA system VapC family ribonuclease toxin [Burkholderiaceae bacterium]